MDRRPRKVDADRAEDLLVPLTGDRLRTRRRSHRRRRRRGTTVQQGIDGGDQLADADGPVGVGLNGEAYARRGQSKRYPDTLDNFADDDDPISIAIPDTRTCRGGNGARNPNGRTDQCGAPDSGRSGARPYAHAADL